MSQSTRTPAPFFAGAKISLGNVKITGKKFEDYHPLEIAYILARWMKEHSEDGGKTWQGSLTQAVRSIWPEVTEEISNFSNSSIAKRLYYFLREYGVRNSRPNRTSLRPDATVWYLPSDLDDEAAKRLTRRMNDEITEMQKKIEEKVVVIRCLHCSAGPFESHEAFMSHRQEKHPDISQVEPVEEAADLRQVKSRIVDDVPTAKSVNCPECGTKVSQDGLKGHLWAAHKKSMCKVCGRTMDPKGLGGHARSHKKTLSTEIKDLLHAIRENPGRAPADYAKMLGISRDAASRRGVKLRDRGYITTSGTRGSTRYHLTSKGRGRNGGPAKVADKPSVAVPEPAIQNAKQIPLTEVISALAEGRGQVQNIGNAQLFITDDGSVYVVAETAAVKVN